MAATATKEQIFEYVIVLHPTDKAKKDGEHAKIVAGPEVLLAVDIDVAKTKAVMALAKSNPFKEGESRLSSAEWHGAEDRLEVAVRPFCEG